MSNRGTQVRNGRPTQANLQKSIHRYRTEAKGLRRKVDALLAQRDALLDAVKEAEARLAVYELNYGVGLAGEAYDDAYTARRTLAAAIKLAEGDAS